MLKINRIIVVTLILLSSLYAKDDVLLLDTSGSMSNTKVVSTVKKLTQEYLDKGKSIVAFNDTAYTVHSVDDLNFDGGTAMSKALKSVNTKQYRFVVIITDGEADNSEATIHEAKLLHEQNIKICSVYLSASSASIPDVLFNISDQVFQSSNIKAAFQMCSGEVRKKLLGIGAVKKTVNPSRFNLF